MIPFCPMDTKHIQYLEVGDTFHETGYGQCLNLKVIDKPMLNGYQWTWKAINVDTYAIVDYLVTLNSPCYINLYFTEETYYRLTRLGLGFSKVSGTTTVHTLPSTSLSKAKVTDMIKDAHRLYGSRYKYKPKDTEIDPATMPF